MEALGRTLSEGFLLELVVKGALLMALAFAVAFVFHRASAAIRHAVWSLAFIGLLLLPIGAVLLPAVNVTVPYLPARERVEATGRSSSSGIAIGNPAAIENQTEVAGDEAVATNEAVATGEAVDTEAATSARAAAAEAGGNGEPVSSDYVAPVVAAPPFAKIPWGGLVLGIWLAGALFFLIRLALVLGKLSLLRRIARTVADPVWRELAEILPEALGIRRPVLVLEHESIMVPMTYGVRRPVILLPVHANDWSEDQKHVTLMHELLHIQRYDHLVHVLALSARALHWFNPLTWAATKRLVVERERACDDGVLATGVGSASYADHLLGMARYVLTGNEASRVALAMARSSELRSRIIAILNPGQPRRSITGFRAVGMAGFALAFVVLLSAMQPAGAKKATDTTLPADEEEAISHSVQSLSVPDTVDETETPSQSHEADPAPAVESADTVDVEAQRRALHAISELPQEQAIPLLRDVAQTHPNTELREEAIFWLGQVGDGSTADLLEKFARNDVSEEVQKKAVFALSELEDELGVPRLRNLASTHSSDEVRAEVVFWLGQVGGENVADDLEAFARKDASEEVQKKAIFALSELNGNVGTPRLIDLAKTHPNPDMQAEAVFWIGQGGGADAAGVLADFARNGKNSEIRKKAVFALSQLDDAAGVDVLIDLARNHPDAELRKEAIFWLGETGDPRAADILMDIINAR